MKTDTTVYQVRQLEVVPEPDGGWTQNDYAVTGHITIADEEEIVPALIAAGYLGDFLFEVRWVDDEIVEVLSAKDMRPILGLYAEVDG